MSRLLVIESSVRQIGSVSRQLTEQFLTRWVQQNPTDVVLRRDLGRFPLPHLDERLLSAWTLADEQRTEEQRAALRRADELTGELLQADLLLLGVPMYNFAIPSTLKAWFDHVLRAGVTFRYTENGPQGLLQGKRAVVITARGGIYAGGNLDCQEPYLRQVLGFVGIHDVTFIHAEGLNMGAELMTKGVTAAEQQIQQFV
jgi:FMN-dependent NADH-azoreductase